MIQVHVVNFKNQHLYKDEMEAFFRMRHNSYAIERRWVPTSPDGRELDDYDTPDATYLLALDEGQVVGSSRFVGCDKRHLTLDHFAHICEKPLPRDPDWAEWTRGTVIPSRRGSKHRGLSGLITTAVMEFAVEEGISWIGGIQDFYMLSRWSELGWHTVPLSLPHNVNGEEFIVAYMRCDEDALASARSVCGVDRPLLVRRGIQVPFIRRDTERPAP